MRSVLARRGAVCALLGLFGLALGGCWNPFAPPGGGGGHDTDVQYKVRSSRENVLYNIQTAYVYMNADEYLDCLAEDFIFILNPADVNDPEHNLPPSWDKAEEENIHRNMFGDESDVESISLTLTNVTISHDPGEDPYDPSDDRWEYQEQTDLRVNVPEEGDIKTYLATADQLFIFQIDPYETGPDGETLYEIVEWQDRPEQKRPAEPAGGEEAITFGRLKAMYRGR